MKRPIPQRLLTIIILGICIVANLAIRPLSLRSDFSNGRAYSISQASKKIIKALPKPVSITFFSSKNIPSTLTTVRQEIDDFLTEYRVQTGGKKMSYTLKDPESDKKAQEEIQNYSIPQLQFSQQDQDKFALQNAYFGIGVMYDGKRASLPQVTDVRDLEYNLTSILYKLNTTTLPTVGVLGATGGLSQLKSLSSVSRSQFNIEETDKANSKFKSLIVFGEKSKQYTEDEVSELKNYLKNGGSILFFVDGVSVSDALVPEDATHGLFGLLRTIGVGVEKNLVLSEASELVSFGAGDQSQTIYPTVLQYKYWIKTNEFAKQSLLSNVSVLVFPWSSSIKISKDSNLLVKSESQSWIETKDYNLSPGANQEQKNIKERAYPLVAMGSFGKGKFIVIPSSRFIQDGFLSRTNDNMELVMNVLSEYTSGGALSGIRSRSVEYYPLPQFIEPVKNTIKYTQIFLGPVLFTLVGLVVLINRSKQK